MGGLRVQRHTMDAAVASDVWRTTHFSIELPSRPITLRALAKAGAVVVLSAREAPTGEHIRAIESVAIMVGSLFERSAPSSMA
jgi:hypothetical protein